MASPFWTTKTVKGRKYLYLEKRRRQGGKVCCTSAYIMPLEVWKRACWLAAPARNRNKVAESLAQLASRTFSAATMNIIAMAYAAEDHGRKRPYYDALRRMAAVIGEPRAQLRVRMGRGKAAMQKAHPVKRNPDTTEGLSAQALRETRKARRIEATRKVIRRLAKQQKYWQAARLLRITGEAPEQYGFGRREA